jgi:alkylation response protein AidB-like acyl-CoA dehydrogenase
MQRHLLRAELDAAPAPSLGGLGAHLIGPVIIAFGDAAQKQRFLPRIANADDWWCQGFSEPDAGSDLASLRTTARRDGDRYIVNGQKTWTTYAHYADWIFCLVRTRTTQRRQQDISLLLIDMRSPGVELRPIALIDGAPAGMHEVNDVFFRDVEVPVANLVGDEHCGWDYAKYMLSNERTISSRVGISAERLRNLKRIVVAGAATQHQPRILERIVALETEIQAHEITVLRVVTARPPDADAKPDALSSMLKLRGSEIQQKVSELYLAYAGIEALRGGGRGAGAPRPSGDDEMAWVESAAANYFNWRKLSIFAGSNEIQRNILAGAVLGLRGK